MSMYNRRKSKKLVNYKRFLPFVILVLIFATGGVIWFLDDSGSKPNPLQPGEINFNPPTEQDSKRVEENKERIVNEQQNLVPPGNSSDSKIVTPIITYAGQYGSQIEVSAYITGLIEEGGTCTAIFSKDSVSFQRSVTGVSDANSVNCPVIAVGTNDFPVKGSWQVKISYDSFSAKGVSSEKTIGVK